MHFGDITSARLIMVEKLGPLQPHILEKRIDAFRDWGKQQGFDAIVIFGQGSALGTATRSHGNLRFLLDWDADAAPSALVIPASGAPSLVVANIFAAMRAQEVKLLAQSRFAKGAALAKTIVEWLPAGAKRIAIAGRDEMPFAIWQLLAAAGAADWTSCDAELARLRGVKDGVQIAYHRQAAAICDRIFERFGPALHSGKPVFQIQHELEALGRDLGCDYCDTWMTVRPIADRCRYLDGENQNVPQKGDQALLGIMLIFQGHWGHAIRTGSIGAPSQGAKDVFKIVEDMHRAMIDNLRPGVDLRLVGKAGVTDASQLGSFFQFRGGHALGHSYEDPIGSDEFPQPYDAAAKIPEKPRPAEAGMLFEVHPNLFVDGLAGASIGDMVLVTESGPEILTKHESGLIQF
jgi:Xaa-Pro aminopeptidase